MTTLPGNQAETGGTRHDAPATGTRSRGGWSIFLCDEKGNVVSCAGRERRPCPAEPGCDEIRDVPPGQRLLFVRS